VLTQPAFVEVVNKMNRILFWADVDGHHEAMKTTVRLNRLNGSFFTDQAWAGQLHSTTF